MASQSNREEEKPRPCATLPSTNLSHGLIWDRTRAWKNRRGSDDKPVKMVGSQPRSETISSRILLRGVTAVEAVRWVRTVSTTKHRAPFFSGVSVQACQLHVSACILNATILKQRLYLQHEQIYI